MDNEKLTLVLPDGTTFEAIILDNKECHNNRPAIVMGLLVEKMVNGFGLLMVKK